MKKVKQRLNIGDVVEYIGRSRSFWPQGEQHIITDVEWIQGQFEYSTDRGAWFTRKEFKYLRSATRKELIAAMERK